ncbi:hypothetical protein HDU76_002801 [Blyttiomyces sp. JEL0837]|nr:hypothetical protein HDU76_002801 [Blyttiomyces sp. JEL0837]
MDSTRNYASTSSHVAGVRSNQESTTTNGTRVHVVNSSTTAASKNNKRKWEENGNGDENEGDLGTAGEGEGGSGNVDDMDIERIKKMRRSRDIFIDFNSFETVEDDRVEELAVVEGHSKFVNVDKDGSEATTTIMSQSSKVSLKRRRSRGDDEEETNEGSSEQHHGHGQMFDGLRRVSLRSFEMRLSHRYVHPKPPTFKSRRTFHVGPQLPPWLTGSLYEDRKAQARRDQSNRHGEDKLCFHHELCKHLDEEIGHMIAYFSATPGEEALRANVIQRYSNAIVPRFPGTSVRCFGSTGTGLLLPWSDIDLVIVDAHREGEPEQGQMSSKLSKIAKRIRQAQLSYDVQVIKRARVPIVKVKDQKTGLLMDFTYHTLGGLKAVDIVREWADSIPGFKPLVMLLKQFLLVRDLSEVFHGGVGGYGVVLWVLAFMRMRKSPDFAHVFRNMPHHRGAASYPNCPECNQAGRHSSHDHSHVNLGELFMDFCFLFGRQFDYHNLGISLGRGRDGSISLFDKRSSGHLLPQQPYLLSILDPLDTRIDVTKGSSRIQEVTSALSDAFSDMENEWRAMKSARGGAAAGFNGGDQESKRRKLDGGGRGDFPKPFNRGQDAYLVSGRNTGSLLGRILCVSNEMLAKRRHLTELIRQMGPIASFSQREGNGQRKVVKGASAKQEEANGRGGTHQARVVEKVTEKRDVEIDEGDLSDSDDEHIVAGIMTNDDGEGSGSEDEVTEDEFDGVLFEEDGRVIDTGAGSNDDTISIASSSYTNSSMTTHPAHPSAKSHHPNAKRRTGFNGRDHKETRPPQPKSKTALKKLRMMGPSEHTMSPKRLRKQERRALGTRESAFEYNESSFTKPQGKNNKKGPKDNGEKYKGKHAKYNLGNGKGGKASARRKDPFVGEDFVSFGSSPSKSSSRGRNGSADGRSYGKGGSKGGKGHLKKEKVGHSRSKQKGGRQYSD